MTIEEIVRDAVTTIKQLQSEVDRFKQLLLDEQDARSDEKLYYEDRIAELS
jgi:FtsZ-binding cell division protein ZapB